VTSVMKAAIVAMNGARRRYPEARVGDKFGDRKVINTLPRRADPSRRSDERVRWRCVCGKEGESYVFNLRANLPKCRHRSARFTPSLSPRADTDCICGHSHGDHRPRGGACLDDDCDCTSFEREVEARATMEG
jgi:hypothetical protein